MAKQNRNGPLDRSQRVRGAPTVDAGALAVAGAPEVQATQSGVVQSFTVDATGEGVVLGLFLDNGERIALRLDSGTGWRLSQRLGVASARTAHEMTDEGANAIPGAVRAVGTDTHAREALRGEVSKAQGSPDFAKAGLTRQQRANEIARLSAEQEARERAERK